MQNNINKLNEKDKSITKRLGIRKTIKLAKLTNKIYNTICIDCKSKVLKDSHTDYNNFCPACKTLIKPYLEKIEALTK